MMALFPNDRLYQKSHEWAVIKGATATVGISDFAQEELNDIVYVELPEVGDEFDQGEAFAVVESVKAASDIYSPIAGEIVEYNLQAGQSLRVDPGHVALFDPTVDFGLTRVQGVKNIIFSGEGLFLANLTGPGRVWLQSMPLPNLAARLAQYLPKSS